MKRENKYILGTVGEIAECIADEVFEFISSNYTDFISSSHIQDKLKVYNFAIAEILSDDELLEEVASGANGWYGIRQIETGFDSGGIDLFADYYGGGSGQYGFLDYDYGKDDCVMIIKEMIMNAFNVRECCCDDETLIIAEIAE